MVSLGVGSIVTIQYLRALAASLVVLHHAFVLLPENGRLDWPLGPFGVEIFFVISGFVMWVTTHDGRRTPDEFWKARIRRIVPLYWFYTSLFIAAAVAGLTSFPFPSFDLLFVLKSYLFVPATNPESGLTQPLYGLGWSLNYEMFFYLLFGLALFIRRNGWRLIAVSTALVVLVVAGCILEPADPILRTYTGILLLDFLAGIVLGRVSPLLMQWPRTVGVLLIAGGIAMAGTPWAAPTFLGPAAVLIVAGAVVMEPLARRRINRVGLLLGDASYSIYLAHPFFQRAAGLLLRKISFLPDVAVVVIGVLAGIAGGVVSYLLIERNLFAIWTRRRTVVPATGDMREGKPAA
jgi:peptidoglycan/LPS O-acetylase OafA/YrhL